MRHGANITNAAFTQDDGRFFIGKNVQTDKVFVEGDGGRTDLVPCLGDEAMAGVVQLCGGGIQRIADVDQGPSTPVRRRGQTRHETFHFMVEFKLQTGRVGKTRGRCIHPNLHRCVQGGDGTFRDHFQAVGAGAGVGVRLNACGANRVVSLEFEIDDQAYVIGGVEPCIIAHFRTIPSVAFRNSVAVERCHLVGFVATAVIDALSDVIGGFSNICHDPRGGVGIGLGGWKRRDVIALARPLRVGCRGRGPSLVSSEGEVVIFVDGRICGGDGDVAENLFEEGDAARHKANVHVKLASNRSKVAHSKVFGLGELNVDVAGETLQRHA